MLKFQWITVPRAVRRGFGRWSFIIGIVAITVCPWLWRRSTIERKWAAIKITIHQLAEEAGTRGGPRRTLLSTPEAGNAWMEYEQAIKHMPCIQITTHDLWQLLNECPHDLRKVRDDLVVSSQVALDHVRKGVRKAEARLPLDWNQPVNGSRTARGRLWELGVAAICNVRNLRELKNRGDALDLLLVTTIFARDLAHDGFLDSRPAFSILSQACNEIRLMITDESMTRSDYLRIKEALRAVDSCFPTEGLCTLNTIALMGYQRLGNVPWHQMFEGLKSSVHGPITPGWRFAYSVELLEANAFERWLAVANRYTLTGTYSWTEARAMIGNAQQILLSTPSNGIAELLVSDLKLPSIELERRVLAQVRILRVAAGYLWNGEVESIEDPFGAETENVELLESGIQKRRMRVPAILRTVVKGNERVFWSVGPDGIDDQGNGDWGPTGKDIVLSVRK